MSRTNIQSGNLLQARERSSGNVNAFVLFRDLRQETAIAYPHCTEYTYSFSVGFLQYYGICVFRRIPCPYPASMLVEMALVEKNKRLSFKKKSYYFFLNSSLLTSSPFAITGLGFLSRKPNFRNILWHCLVPRTIPYFSLM